MLAAWISMRSSPARGSGSGTSPYSSTSGPPYLRKKLAFMESILFRISWNEDRHIQPRHAARIPRAGENPLEGGRHGETHVEPAHAVGHRAPRRHAAREVPRCAAGHHARAAEPGAPGRRDEIARIRARRERRHGPDVQEVSEGIPCVRRLRANEQPEGRA